MQCHNYGMFNHIHTSTYIHTYALLFFLTINLLIWFVFSWRSYASIWLKWASLEVEYKQWSSAAAGQREEKSQSSLNINLCFSWTLACCCRSREGKYTNNKPHTTSPSHFIRRQLQPRSSISGPNYPKLTTCTPATFTSCWMHIVS